MEELYSQAVGVLGIAPPFFYDMTPHEVNLAFEGFLTKLELQGNVMLMALRQRDVKKAKPISLHNKNEEQNGKGNASVKKSTLEARQATLEALGIS